MFLNKLFGDPNTRYIQSLQPIVDEINALESTYANLTNEELSNQTQLLKEQLASGKTLDDIVPQAFAVCREASRRHLHMRHFDVQLLGALVLHRGQIAEMRTGEGKTLMATLAVYVNALSGKGVHVVTVNDYLAKRDAVWMGTIYHALGLSVASIAHEIAFLYDPTYQGTPEEQERDEPEGDSTMSYKVEHAFLRPCSRKEAYMADITYGTNNEFGFDYLKDNLAPDTHDMVQRDLNFAIIDEVDSILIDEARTPLIISAPAEESAELYHSFARIAGQLIEKEDYLVDEKMRASTLTESGIKKVEVQLGIDNIYTPATIELVHHIEQALKAHALFKRDKDYVVKDGEVIIVDEFTGRLMHGRRYSEGLHQAIEAKERVDVQRESKTYATITFQNLFRLYGKLSGMTGTAATEAEEFSKIYKLEVAIIPTNRSMIRKDLSDRVYKNETGKYKAVVDEIKERHKAGQPVLVGTISIEKNEVLGKLLEREGIPHTMLNAKNHEKEGEIIAQAGKLGAVTIATNMAGRGVDILLGGNPPDEAEREKVRETGGLLVIGTERHESRRIDNQLRGRAGRQGDPGATQFYVSMEDDLMRVFGSERMKGLMDKLGIPEDMPIENKMVSKSIEEAQKKVETHNFDIRKHVLEYDDVMNKHREVIYKRRRNILDQYHTETHAHDDQAPTASPESHKTLKELILDMISDEIEQIVLFHGQAEKNQEEIVKEIENAISGIFELTPEVAVRIQDLIKEGGDKLANIAARTELFELLDSEAKKAYEEFEGRIAEQIKNYAQMTDPHAVVRQIEKDLMLRSLDSLWVEHLDSIEHLRHGIGLRGYGQHDPLVEFKKESYRLFKELLALIQKQVVYSIFKIGMAAQNLQPQKKTIQGMQLSAPSKTSDDSQSSEHSLGQKVGRNDVCPCGSGKKFKRCHGA